MVYRGLIIVVLLITISGCASAKRDLVSPGLPALMQDIYDLSVGDAQKDVVRFIEENLKEQKTFGYVNPYIPVIEPPVTRKVWIPDHESTDDTGVLVAGHWVYVMLEGPKWFIEGQTNKVELPVIVPGKPAQENGT